MELNINSLIFNKKVYDKGPNIVVIGGGTGLNTVLSGLKNYTSNLTAIVTVSNYGEEIHRLPNAERCISSHSHDRYSKIRNGSCWDSSFISII